MSFFLPDLKIKCSGWIDHDRHILNDPTLSTNDRIVYLKNRFDLIFFNSMDRVFLNAASRHRAVNSSTMSFFLIGTTVLCCAIEAAGGFVLGHGLLDRNKEKFKKFISAYLPRWYKTAKGTRLADWMWRNLRNSLAHSLTITEGGMAHLGKKRIRERVQGQIEIHVELLYKDFKRGFERYISDLSNHKKKRLRTRFEKCFREAFRC